MKIISIINIFSRKKTVEKKETNLPDVIDQPHFSLYIHENIIKNCVGTEICL